MEEVGTLKMMEKMKKSLLFAAVAAVVLASCAKEPVETAVNENAASEFSIVAKVADDATKGSIDGTGAYTWTTGDKIGMLVDGTVTALTASEISGDDATFTATGTTWGTAAFYPWHASTTIADGKVTFKLPSTYTWKEGEVFTPMIADLSGEVNPTKVSFKLAGAGVRVTLKKVPAYANLVALTVDGKNIKGNLAMNITDAGTEGIKATDGSSSTVYMKFDQGTAERNMVFTFPVPVIESSSSIKIDLYTGTDTGTKMSIFSKTGTIPALSRGQIVNTPELTVSNAPKLTRLFGKYATGASTPWTTSLGIEASSDRNVAVDDNYVYIAETNTSGNIWMLNNADGSVAGKVKTDEVTGVGTFYFACPRVLKMGAGSVLCVTNMQMETSGALHLYVWENGVDKNPTDINLYWEYADCRIGEGWTFWQKPGDPTKTLLYFDGRSNDGVRIWKFTNWAKGSIGTSGSQHWVDARRLFDGGVATSCDASFWVFPDNKNKGIWTSRTADNVNVPHYSVATNDVWSNSVGAADQVTNTDITSGYFAGVKGFQFIEHGNNRYIAYLKRAWNDTAGGSVYMLMVLGGGKTDTWEDIIGNRANNLIYVESLAANEEGLNNIVTAHKMHPTHSAFDINAFTASDTESYIATDIQCASLCLFKLEN